MWNVFKRTTVSILPHLGKLGVCFACFLLGGLVVATVTIPRIESQSSPLPAKKIPSLGDLLIAKPGELQEYDIALLNLLSAQGLPGAEKLDIERELHTLDQWAQIAEIEIRRNHDRFVKSPLEFGFSESHYKAIALVNVIQEQFGIQYNPELMHKAPGADSRDYFIHGLLTEKHSGTCASMPVLYVAIGRRLGYPLYLVSCREHVLARWVDGEESFNLEGAGNGASIRDDKYYLNLLKLSESEKQSGQYLRPLTVSEELGLFTQLRGCCLESAGWISESRACFALAHRLAPRDPFNLQLLCDSLSIPTAGIPHPFIQKLASNQHTQR